MKFVISFNLVLYKDKQLVITLGKCKLQSKVTKRKCDNTIFKSRKSDLSFGWRCTCRLLSQGHRQPPRAGSCQGLKARSFSKD